MKLAFCFNFKNITPSSSSYEVIMRVASTSALTIGFTHIMGGQQAADEFFWGRESFVTLSRESQEAVKEYRREQLSSTIRAVQSLSSVMAIRARGFLSRVIKYSSNGNDHDLLPVK